MALDELLRNHAFAQGLGDAQIARLASLASPITFEEDEIILERGQRSESFYLVTSGSVAIELRTPQITVCLEALGPGQAFGWSAFLGDQDTTFRVRARQHTTALRLKGAELGCMCNTDPQLGCEVLRRALKIVANRVKAAEARFAEMCGVRV